jgi:glycosyltransferase involved in cell wall biosynthesis
MEENRKRDRQPTRHCMVVHAYYPLMETRVERQALALLDHDIEVDIICLRDSDEAAFDIVDGVQVHRLPVKRHKGSGIVVQLLEYLSFFVLAFFRLSKLHRQRHYDVIQVHNLPDFLVFVALIPKLSGARVILDLHDLMPEFYAERFQRSTDSLPVRLVCWQERISCWFADHVITVTEHWRQALVKRGVPPERCSVVMNLADNRIFYPLSAQDDRVKGNSRFCLLYHGTMAERYGLDLVLQAMDRIRNDIPEIHLTLVGGGEHLETLKCIAEDLDLKESHVEFMDSVPVEQLPPLIASADLGVVPYRDDVFTDSLLPTKLLEYAAMGLPAIAARTSAIFAYFDEAMVQFFTPGDAEELASCILRLHRDGSLLANLARSIMKFNEQYNWPDQSAEYVQLVRRLGDKPT